MEQNVIEAMNWRYAVQKFDTSKTLSDEQVAELMEATRLSASSFGIEPWHFIVVTNPEVRQELMASAYGQTKVAESSHLVVFAYKTDAHKALDDHIRAMSAAQNVPIDQLEGFRQAVANSLMNRTPEQTQRWLSEQVHIAFGTLLETAALMGIDAAPMGGLDPDAFDRILGLEEQGLHTAVIAALGHRDPSDPAAQRPKVRLSAADAISYVK